MVVPRITPQVLKERLDAAGADAPVILDVRLKYPYEHSSVMLPGAVRMAPSAIELSKLPRDREIVLYDSDPEELVSAGIAQELLRAGYRVSVLAGGVNAWVAAKFPADSKPSPQPAPAAAPAPKA